MEQKTKSQKSQFWIWTTLWLTTILDSVLIFLVFFAVLVGIAQVVKIPIVLFILALIARILSLWLGAYVAVKYVLKKTIIYKKDASKFAFLAVLIPLLGSIAAIVFSEFDFKNLAGNIVSAVIVLGITYYSVESLITKHGNE